MWDFSKPGQWKTFVIENQPLEGFTLHFRFLSLGAYNHNKRERGVMSILGHDEIVVVSTEDLNSDTAHGVIERLLEASGRSHRGVLIVLNCYGGSSDAARAVIDVMKLLPDRVAVFATGAAHSAAALILAAGAKGERYISRTASLFLHETLQSLDEWQTGQRQLREAKHTLWLDGIYAKMLADLTGQPLEKVDEWRKEGLYMYAEEAVENGFADQIVDWSP